MEINNNVCRLCMSEKELVWIFDQRFCESEKNMKNVVMVTTGVEMLEKDTVSQYICSNCCKLTVKMFDFRERAVKTDRYLKLQNQSKELQIDSEIKLNIPNTSVSITKEKIIDSVPMKPKLTIKNVPSTSKTSEVGESSEIKTATEIKIENTANNVNPNRFNEVQKQLRINVHPSIQQIFSTYADIKISTGCLKFDVNPVVSMQMNCVEEYFKRRNVDMKKHVHKVLRTMRASKKTSALHPSKSIKNNHENPGVIVDENKPGTSKDIVIGRVSPISLHPSKSIQNNHENQRVIVDENKPATSKEIINGRVSPISLYPSTSIQNNHENPGAIVDENKPGTSKEIVNGRVSPIIIKLSDVNNDSNKRKLEDDDDSEDYIINKTTRIKRRRLSSGDFTSSPERIQPTLMETVQIKPKTNNKCNLCDVTNVNAKALKKHYRQHFTCSYCRSKFRVLERRENHVKTCAYKHALTSLTYVDLETLDLTKYKLKTPGLQETNEDDIIELSDNEDSTMLQLDNSTPQVPKNVPIAPLIRQQTINPGSELVQYFSTAVVKPSIKFMDTHILNRINISNPDVKVLKELVTQTGNLNMKLAVDGEAQTTLPSNEQIVKDDLYANAQLKNLSPHLYVYKVPIDIKYGKFNISYTENKQKEKKKVIDHWANTKVVDVTGKQSPNLNADLNRRLAEGISLFATPTNNSSQQVDQTCNIQSQNLPLSGIVPSSNVPQQPPTTSVLMHNMPRTKQVLTSNLQIQNIPQTKQALSNNFQMQKMPQTKQALNSNLQKQKIPQTKQGQMHNMPQTKQFVTNNMQMPNMPQTKQVITSNVQMHNTPQTKQVVTSNVQMHNMPQTKQVVTSNVQMYNTPQTKIITSNAQMHNTPQTKQVVTSNVQMHNIPQTKQVGTSNVQMNNTPQTKQVVTSNVQTHNMPQTKQFVTSNVQMHNMPQTKQVVTSNVQVHNMPQTKQVSTSNVEMHNIPQAKQVGTSNVQMHNTSKTKQVITSNAQMHNVPQTKQVGTSNVQMHNKPQTKQMLTSNVPKHILPNVVQTGNGQNHILTNPVETSNIPNYISPKSVQTSNIQIPNLPPHIIVQKLPLQVPTIPVNQLVQNTNQGLQNTVQVSSLTSNGNSLSNPYFYQSNGTNLNANSQIVNTTNSNTQGFVNSIPFTQQNMNLSIAYSNSLSQTSPLLNYTIPANNSMPNMISTRPSSVINTSSASKTPPSNINFFSSNTGTNLRVGNTNTACNTNFNNSRGQTVHKPQIRVRNLCELK